MKSAAAFGLSFIVAVLSPGVGCYAALGQMVRSQGTGTPAPTIPAPSLGPAQGAREELALPDSLMAPEAANIPDVRAALPEAAMQLKEIPAADAKTDGQAAPAARESLEAGAEEVGRNPGSPAALDAVFSGSRRRMHAGSAFGSGPSYTSENHQLVNEGIAGGFGAGRAGLVHGTPGPDTTLGQASAEEKRALQEALTDLNLPAAPVEIDGLGPVLLQQALAALKRIVLVDPAAPGIETLSHPRALRYASFSDFQVSHVGFGPDHQTPSIYIDRAFFSAAAPAYIRALLVNDLIELGAMMLARSASVAWTEDLAKKVQERAARAVSRLYPRAIHYTRAVVGGFGADFSELGIPPQGILPEFLLEDDNKQQVLLNRLAALRAKGFSADEITPELLRNQRSLDKLVSSDPGRPDADALEDLRDLRTRAEATFSRLTAGLQLGPLIEGEPLVRPLPSDGHSSVQGLALRLHEALEKGRDIGPMLRPFPEDSRFLRELWGSWDRPEQSSIIPVLDRIPQVKTTLANALRKVRAKAAPEQVVFEKEKRSLRNLIEQQPLIEAWSQAQAEVRLEVQDQRDELKSLPPARGKSEAALALKGRKQGLRDDMERLGASADDLKRKVGIMQDRVEALTLLSLGMREWFPEAKGLSVSGDFLWEKDGKNLEVLLIAAGKDSPRRLRPEVLREFSGLKGLEGLEISGYLVGESWLRDRSLDVDRNVLISRFSILGLSLWGPNVGKVFDRLPLKELWTAALEQLEDARGMLASSSWPRARHHLRLVLNIITSAGLNLYGRSFLERLPGWMELVEEDGRMEDLAVDGSLREALLAQAERLRESLEPLKERGRIRELERHLERQFDRQRYRNAPGRVGGVLLGGSNAWAQGMGRKNLFELSPEESARWLSQTAELAEGADVPDVQERLKSVLERVKARARYWEWYPETLSAGQFVTVGKTALGRPVEVRVRVNELTDQPELMGLVVEAVPGRDASDGADRYEIFLNGAVFNMARHVQEVVLRSLIRQIELAMTGMPLNEARDRAMAELMLPRVRDDKKDREVLDQAMSDYRKGIRIGDVADAPPSGPPGSGSTHLWRRRARQEEVMRLAQGVSDYLRSPQRHSGGSVLLGYTTEDMLPFVETMAEVFAGNGIRAYIVREESVPGAMHHAVREGPYRLGFLVSRDAVLPFGHFLGGIPPGEAAEIVAAENAVKRVRRLQTGAARLHGLLADKTGLRDAYLNSLRERFNMESIRRSGLRLLVDTDQSEVGVLLRALGLRDGSSDFGENMDALRDRVRQAPSGERRLGVSFARREPRLQFLDLDGGEITSSDLSLIFTWYLVRHRGYQGRIYRAFTQTRLLDQLAHNENLAVDEVDPSVWGITEADSIILSPWTPYNDLLTQVLLAAEIVTSTGQSLRSLLESIRRELGAPLHYRKGRFPVPAQYLDRISESLSDENLKQMLAGSLGLPPGSVHVRRAMNGIQVSFDHGGWFFLRWTGKDIEFYAEDPSAARSERMVSVGEAFVRQSLGKLGPSRALRWSFLFATVVIGAGAALVLLALADPAVAERTPILGTIYNLVGRLVQLGFGALQWLLPNFMRHMIPSWNNRWVMSVAALMFLEFFWYWGTRGLTYLASVARIRPRGELAPEIERLPDLPKQPRAESVDYFIVAPLKDGRLAVLKPAFSRIVQWIQALLYTYEAETLIQGKKYDDSGVTLRGTMNARGWIFFKIMLLEPFIIFLTWWDLLCASFPGFVGAVFRGLRPIHRAWNALRRKPSSWNPVRGLPTHLSPAIAVPLPAALRGRYRTEWAEVKKVSDGDTIEIFDGSFWGSRWVRYKGMDTSDVKRGDLYRRGKERNIQSVRGKKVLLLIPQVKQGEYTADEYDDKGRLLSYVYKPDPSGQWISMTHLLLREGLATTEKGAPDPEVPFSLDVFEPAGGSRSALDSAAAAPAPEVEGMPAEVLLPERVMRQRLQPIGGQVAPTAQVRLEASFTGDQGQLIPERLGTGIVLGENGQLFLSGSAVRIRKNLRVGAGARLHLQALGAADSAQAGVIQVGSGVSVEGRFRAVVPAGARLRILSGTRLTGDRDLTVPAGHVVTVRSTPEGELDVRSEYHHPRMLWQRLWSAFRRGDSPEAHGKVIGENHLDSQRVTEWWRSDPARTYDSVAMSAKLSQLKNVGRLPAAGLQHKHKDHIEAAVEAQRQRMLRSARTVPEKYLMRKQGDQWRLKQGLIIGVDEYYRTRIEHQMARMQGLLAATRSALERGLTEAGRRPAEIRRFIHVLMKGNEDDWEEQQEIANQLSGRSQRAVAQIRREKQALDLLEELRGVEVGHYVGRAKERVAELAGLLLLGPARVPDAVSVVAGGSYLLSAKPETLELLVVRRGDAGPRVVDAALLNGIPLPPFLKQVRVVSVGEAWLAKQRRDAMRNRLLTRFLVTGTTLWGRDIVAARAEQTGHKMPFENYLSLAAELIREGTLDSAYLAHLTLMTAAPGIEVRVREQEEASAEEVLRPVRGQLRDAASWLKGERLRGIIGRGMDQVASQPGTDSGLGGVFIGDVRSPELGRKPLFQVTSSEAQEWIRRTAAAAVPVDEARHKLNALLERLKARGQWWDWYPERLEAGKYTVVGRNSRGRTVEVKVSLYTAAGQPGLLAVMANAEEGRKISDVERYEVFLNGIILEMDPEAQEAVLDSVVRQLSLVLSGASLRRAHDVSGQELAASAEGSRSKKDKLFDAVQDHARGVRVVEVAHDMQIPWENSAWNAALSGTDAKRLAQAVAGYAKSAERPSRSRVLIGFASEAERAAAKEAAEVFAGNGVQVTLQESPAAREAFTGGLRTGDSELGVLIGSDQTVILGKDGQPLPLAFSNQIGWLALSTRFARLLSLDRAQEQGISRQAPAPPAGAAAPAPASAPEAPAGPRPASSAVWQTFLLHALFVAALAAIVLTTVYFPGTVYSLPVAHTIFDLMRSMMMFKSFFIIDNAWIFGLILASALTALRYFHYGRITHKMAKMAQGGEHYRGLIPELEDLPRVNKASTRGKRWSPIEILPSGRIGIRAENFTRSRPFIQLMIYVHLVAHAKFHQHAYFFSGRVPGLRFFLNMANKLVIGRFKVARVAYFVVTEPFVILLELKMLASAFWEWLRGRPVDLRYRVTSESTQASAVLNAGIRRQFFPEWVTITAILDESTVQLEDGRKIRVIGAGKPGKGVSMATPEAREFLLGKELFLLTPIDQEEGTRRLAGHLYVSNAVSSGNEGASTLIRALHVLAAQNPGRYGPRLPSAALVDSEKLPLILKAEDSPSAGEGTGIARWEKGWALALLGVFLAEGVYAALRLWQFSFSPTAHLLAAVFLAVLSLPALFGLRKLWRGKSGMVIRRKAVSAVLAAAMGGAIVSLFWGPSWATGPVARNLSHATIGVMESTALLPRPGGMGYEGVSEQAAGEEWRHKLPADHPFVRYSRELLNARSLTADWIEVVLPAELGRKYVGQWAYVTRAADGGTLVVYGGRHVRYKGVNAAGEGVLRRTEELVVGKRVLLLTPRSRNKEAVHRLAYVYAPDGNGNLVSADITLLEEGFGNQRHGPPDPLIRRYPTLDPEQLAPKDPPTARAPAGPEAPRLALNPVQSRGYVQEQAVFSRWVGPQMLEVDDGRRIRLRDLDIPEAKQAQALELVQGLLKPGQKIFLLHAKAYGKSGTYQRDAARNLLDYVFAPDGDSGLHQNLNALLDQHGFNSNREGRPDPAIPDVAPLARESVDYERAAWEMAQAPLRSLSVRNPQVLTAYWEHVRQLDQRTAREFQAGVSLLALYSDQGLLTPEEQEPLLVSLLEQGDHEGYGRWVETRLVPALRGSLAEQKIPARQGSWQDVLLGAASGKLGETADSLYFPASAQADRMREFLSRQDIPSDDPIAFGEGVVYAKRHLRFPQELSVLLPGDLLKRSGGALWSPMEMAELHNQLLHGHIHTSPIPMGMAYSYPETPALLLSDARHYIAETHALGRDALGSAELHGRVFQHLEQIISDARLAKLRAAVERGEMKDAAGQLSPAEIFALGRMLSDDPVMSRFHFASLLALRSQAGRLQMQGTSMAEFQRELDALTALPGRGSLAAAPGERYESLNEDSWGMQRRLFAEILVQTVIGMDKEKIPARFLPLLLPRTVEALELKSTRVSSPEDWQAIVASVRGITPVRIRAIMHDIRLQQGLNEGPVLDTGLLSRSIPALLRTEFAREEGAGYVDRAELKQALGFPARGIEWDLQTYKHGTFRADEKNTSAYSNWKAGDRIKIMVGSKNSSRKLFNTEVQSIARKRIRDLTLDDLRPLFPPTRFWTPWKSNEDLRRELIQEELRSLQFYYPGVTEDSWGYVIIFKPFHETQGSH